MLFINNRWIEGEGSVMQSQNPATDDILWEGRESSMAQVDFACQAAETAFASWSQLSFEKRLEKLQRFQLIIETKRKALSEILAQENGKPLWEAEGEIGAMINKLPIALEAYRERCPEKIIPSISGSAWIKHRPHGVVGVFSPFNFPAHLPNGHMIPALLAGNTIILKGSPLTPLVSETIIKCWEEAALPPGVINLLQGGGEVGSALVEHPKLKGILFTGSYKTGQSINISIAKMPEKILALEMGGNNPLVVHDLNPDLNHEQELDAAVYHTIQSAYLTSGQRCTCARRLIVTRSQNGERFVEKLIAAIGKIVVGPFHQKPEPFMGPVISKEAKSYILKGYQVLVQQGAEILVEMQDLGKIGAFLSPGLMDVSRVKNREDEEIFGPLLQLIWVEDFTAAIREANNTRYGLAAGLLTREEKLFQQFFNEVHAGIINWNRPTTGTSSQAPFGGIGRSGNYRPSGYYAADYCAYPVSSLLEKNLQLPEKFSPGLSLL